MNATHNSSYRAAGYLVILTTSASPDWVLAEIPLDADETWSRGAVRGRLRRSEEFSGVLFDSRLPEAEEPMAHVGALLDRLAPHIGAIGRVSKRPKTHIVRMHIVEHTASDNPEIWLDPGKVQMISEMGAGVVFDCYVLPD